MNTIGGKLSRDFGWEITVFQKEFVEFSEAAAGLSETALATASLAEKRAQGRDFANMVNEVKAVKQKMGEA